MTSSLRDTAHHLAAATERATPTVKYIIIPFICLFSCKVLDIMNMDVLQGKNYGSDMFALK